MKTFRLLIVALLLASSASAQRHMRDGRNGEYSPTVYLISVHEVDTIYNCGGCGSRQAAALNRLAMDNATQDYIETHRPGFQQSEKPQFVFASKNNRFSFSLGGFVSLRAGYDLDASTSRLFMKAITNTRALGRVVIYMDADFRGGAEGSYTPRLRSAYVSFKGLTLGRDVTTFCDLQAAPTTIDFQGPNAYNFNFATMIRYEVSFARRHMTFGVAAEMPNVSATYGENFKPMHQRVPDFPMYLQYAWGDDRSSHIRASGVIRNPYMHKVSKNSTTSLLGWGVQFSGTIKCCDWFRLFMNGVYGEGITPYIQDLTGSGLDFTPNPEDPSLVRMMPMWGWQAAGQINITPRLFVSGGYSTVRVQRSHGYYTDDQYKQGQYIFGNIFYSLTPRCKVAGEYLYGSRKDMNSMKNHANRVNVMVQYSF